MKELGVERFLADLLPFFHRRQLTYVDVGAYVGEVFEKTLKSGLRVGEAHVIEPNPKYLDTARERTKSLFQGHSVTYHNVALGRQAGRVRMRDAKDMTKVIGVGGAPAQGIEAENMFEVECTTLDELAEKFSERRISLLKVDVEGFETEVLEGATRILQDERVDVIYIEAGLNPQGTQQTYYRRIEDLLGAYGYKVFRVYEQHHEWIVDSPLLRRVNIAFMSRKFADSNPYRVTQELYRVRSELDSLERDAELARQEIKKATKSLDALRKELLETSMDRDSLRSRVSALEQSQESLLEERDALRQAAELADQRFAQLRAASRSSEQTLRDVFVSIAQMYRREVHAWKEYSAARADLARIQAGRAHRLGAVLAQHAKSPLGWLKAPVALWREYAKDSRESVVPSPEQLPVIVCHADKAISVPLTLAPRSILVPGDAAPRRILVNLLSAHPTGSVTVELTIHAGTGLKHLRSIGGEAPGSHGNEAALIRRFNIGAGMPVALFDIGGGSEDFTFELCRVRGEFCILTLEQRSTSSAEGDSAEEQGSLAESASDRRHVFRASALELKLWGGFARYALPALEQLRLDPHASRSQREDAAWSLTRWFYAEGDYQKALENLEFSKELKKEQRPRAVLAELMCLIRLGRYKEASVALERAMEDNEQVDLRLLKSTVVRHLEQERGSSPEQVDAAQLAALNAVLARSGLAPLEKRRAHEPLSLANITARAQPKSGNQAQKVSVILPAFNAAETIEWVLDSILNQTWRNLEVIVVDDFSTDSTCEIVERVARADSRVHLVRRDSNGGAYPARNIGARHATGDLVTVHDSDDWSHPQRIELQVEALAASPGIVAVKSHWVRVGAQLEMLGAWIARGSLYDLNFSSLMFRRELLDSLGLWDEVSVSGDSEFYSRIRAVYGERAVLKIPKDYLLAFSLTRDDSLTRAKATHLRSLFFGLRWNYRDSYLFWHANLGNRAGQLPFDATADKRCFPVPLGNQPGRRGIRQRYDLVVVSDFALNDERFATTLSYLVAGGGIGRKMAVFHWRKYELPSRVPLQPRFYEACLQFGIDILSPGDSVEADVVLCTLPSILQHRIEPMPVIEANRVVVIVGHADGDLIGGQEEHYDPEIVRRHLESIFGTEGDWVPASARVKRIMQQDRRYPTPYPEPWLPMIDASSWSSQPIHWRGAERELPVVRRHGSGGGAKRFKEMDFYVCFPEDLNGDVISEDILDVMGSGIPVILPPQFKESFGDAVVCVSRNDVAEAIGSLWSSRERYLGQAESGRRFVMENRDVAVFADRLQRLLNGPQLRS